MQTFRASHAGRSSWLMSSSSDVVLCREFSHRGEVAHRHVQFQRLLHLRPLHQGFGGSATTEPVDLALAHPERVPRRGETRQMRGQRSTGRATEKPDMHYVPGRAHFGGRERDLLHDGCEFLWRAQERRGRIAQRLAYMRFDARVRRAVDAFCKAEL